MKEERNITLQRIADSLSKRIYGRTLSEAHSMRICVRCGKPARKFKTDIDRKEYEISGLCQKCGDLTFKD